MERIGVHKTIKFYYQHILELRNKLNDYDGARLVIYEEDVQALDGVMDLLDKLENARLKRKGK